MLPAATRPGQPLARPGDVAPTMVAVSGGVDSAVALMRLVNAGVPVQALFMKNWEEDDRDDHCAAAEDLADAQRVCERLDVTLHAVNCSDTYWDKVFARFIRDIESGMTPNPDVACNREVKFTAFVEHARRLGAERVATGHYARLRRTADGVPAAQGRGPRQGSELFPARARFSRSSMAPLFPLGDLCKHAVRVMARKAGLAPHDKPDSTGLCFVGERRFSRFLARFVDAAPGPVETEDGTRIGEHPGLAFFTIGQRRGLGIGGRRNSAPAPWYVAAKDHARNALVVVQGRDHPALLSRRLQVRDMHWIADHAPTLPLTCSAKIRYRQADQACIVRPGERGGNTLELRFERAQWAATPGQYAVLYDGDTCLGGGVIEYADSGAPDRALARSGTRGAITRPSDRECAARLRPG